MHSGLEREGEGYHTRCNNKPIPLPQQDNAIYFIGNSVTDSVFDYPPIPLIGKVNNSPLKKFFFLNDLEACCFFSFCGEVGGGGGVQSGKIM